MTEEQIITLFLGILLYVLGTYEVWYITSFAKKDKEK